MKYCPKCGTPNEDASGFCTNCGAALSAPAMTVPQGTPQQPVQGQPGEKPKKKIGCLPLTLIIIGAFVVLIIIIVAIGTSDSGDTATTTTEVSTSESAEESSTRVEFEEETTTSAPAATLGEKNALSKALSYLDYAGFSEKSLRDQLDYEGFTSDEIDYAIEHCNANWNEECAEKAASYLEYTSFSRQGLQEQLEYEGFTAEQIEYALSAVGY